MIRERDVDDLTTGGGLDPEAPLLVAPGTPRCAGPVPGMLVEGELPQDARAKFVLRIPERWNGSLVVAGAPGLLGERSLDLYWSDFCLSRGFAFGCTDKGARISFENGAIRLPEGPECRIERWYPRLRALASLGAGRCRERFERAPDAIYAVGVSNGGYLARCAVERDPEIFAGAVDVSGVLWRADAPALLRDLPCLLSSEDSSPLAAEYRVFWRLTLQSLLSDLDPEYSGKLEDYDVRLRPEAAARVRAVENTGRLRRPLISIAGGRDPLVPAPAHAVAYAALVKEAGCGDLHRLRVVANGSHVDGDRARHPWAEPLLPHAHEAFLQLTALVAA
ncbi:MAG: tannase/feruloyl esterase family alpha/beta hydrolase [Elusimicrobia bacterium]|nr:tannase/feruloyl esterase family alpha/beta hydrolase [Elusimicrobiota bacterium]